jgi:hypothetical protein
MSQRRKIVNYIIDNLKLIDGTISSLDTNYRFSTDLHTNVYRGFKGIDEINDFPCAYVVAGNETRNYNTDNLTLSNLPIIIRVFTYTEEEELVNNYIGNLIQDVEHVIYNLPSNLDLEIQDIIIQTINSDEGLLAPYGIVEVQIQASYEVRL